MFGNNYQTCKGNFLFQWQLNILYGTCLIFSWLREKHAMPGAINILFSRRADYRVKLSVNNPAFLPSQFEHAHESSGMVIDSTPDEIRHTAREALTRMLEIEKCEKVVLNPLFGSSFPCKPKVLFYKTVINFLKKEI